MHIGLLICENTVEGVVAYKTKTQLQAYADGVGQATDLYGGGCCTLHLEHDDDLPEADAAVFAIADAANLKQGYHDIQDVVDKEVLHTLSGW